MENSIDDNKALTKLNDKHLEIKNDRDILASYLLSPQTKISNPENTSHFKLVRDPSSIGVNVLLTNKAISVTFFNNSMKFCDTNKKFELQGDLLKMMKPKKNYQLELANLWHKKLMFEFS